MGKIIFCSLLILGLSGFAGASFGESADVYYKARYFELLGKARAHESGAGAERDEELACEYYCKAATNPVYSEPEPLERLVQKANDGNFYAEFFLGCFYRYDELRSFDHKKAFYWIDKASQKNYARAIDMLSWYYLSGCVVEMDKKYGGELLMKAAELGYAPAQHRVAKCYTGLSPKLGQGEYYRGVYERSFTEAFYWFKKAAEQGYRPAKYDMGVCYFYGLGVPEDRRKAVEIWEAGAKDFCEQGKKDYDFSFALSRCYYNGWGCEKDEKKSFDVFPYGTTPTAKEKLHKIWIAEKYRYGSINFSFSVWSPF